VAYQEDMSSLYHAFHDRFNDHDKKQKLIKCQICCIEGIPSHSKNSSICEMCFEDDFWDTIEELKKAKTDMLWAIKVVDEGLLNGRYYAKNQYVGHPLHNGGLAIGVDSLGQAYFYQNKVDAITWADSGSNRPSGKLPKFEIVQIMVSEVG